MKDKKSLALRKELAFLMPSLIGGGAERVLLNFIDLLISKGVDITLLVVLKKGIYVSQLPEQVEVHYLFKNEILSKIATKLLQLFNFKGLFHYKLRKFKKKEFRIVINFIDGVYSALLSDLRSKHKITWVHGSYHSNPNFYKYYRNYDFRRNVINNRLRYINDIVFVSEESKEEFVSLFGDSFRMRVIYNPVSELRVKRMSEENYNHRLRKSNVYRLVSVGSLLPVKNYSMLFKALKVLRREGRKFHLSVCGTGPLHDILDSEIIQLGLSNNVSLLGFQDNPYKIIKESDLFIMPSISEALPTALIEAMILGIPTLVTNVSGCREVVDNGRYGLSVECTVKGLVHGIRELMDKPELMEFYRRKSLQRAQSFSDELFLKELYNLLDWENDK